MSDPKVLTYDPEDHIIEFNNSDKKRYRPQYPVFPAVKDSGQKETFENGAWRDTQEGKGRYDLIPYDCLHRVAVHYENGARKYGDNNWQKGMKSSRYFSSAIRHLSKYILGSRDEDHLSAAIWNIMAIMWNEHHKPEYHDIKGEQYTNE